MSIQKHPGARLVGYDGPHFPAGLEQLHQRIGNPTSPISGFVLERVGKVVSGYQGKVIEGPTTNDGYSWFGAVTIQWGSTVVAILFPRCDDFAQEGDSRADRHVAVYVNGGINNEGLQGIIKEIVEGLDAWRAEEAHIRSSGVTRTDAARQYALP